MTTRVIGCIVALIRLSLTEVQAQAGFDGLMERTTECAKCNAHDRLIQRIDESIDTAINETENTVQCAGGPGVRQAGTGNGEDSRQYRLNGCVHSNVLVTPYRNLAV